MDILVTGATGFMGSAITRKLLDRGDNVRVLVRSSSNLKNLRGLNVEHATGDLCDPCSVHLAVKGAEQVYHVAADYRL